EASTGGEMGIGRAPGREIRYIDAEDVPQRCPHGWPRMSSRPLPIGRHLRHGHVQAEAAELEPLGGAGRARLDLCPDLRAFLHGEPGKRECDRAAELADEEPE